MRKSGRLEAKKEKRTDFAFSGVRLYTEDIQNGICDNEEKEEKEA